MQREEKGGGGGGGEGRKKEKIQILYYIQQERWLKTDNAEPPALPCPEPALPLGVLFLLLLLLPYRSASLSGVLVGSSWWVGAAPLSWCPNCSCCRRTCWPGTSGGWSCLGCAARSRSAGRGGKEQRRGGLAEGAGAQLAPPRGPSWGDAAVPAGHPPSAPGAAGRGREGEGVEHGVCVVCARGCVCVHILTAGDISPRLAGPRGEGGGYVSLGGLRGGERPQGECNALSSERFIT